MPSNSFGWLRRQEEGEAKLSSRFAAPQFVENLFLQNKLSKAKVIRQAQEMRKHLKKFFWFSLFTTDAASESRDRLRAMVSGEEENERSEVKENSRLKPEQYR